MDFKARADAALTARDGEALAQLLGEASSKADKKVVKKAIYLAGQRGIEVPDTVSDPAPGASLAAVPIVAMMGPPHPNAGRLFTLPLVSGGTVEVVECFFEMPWGVERLHSAQSTRMQYAPWAEKMCRRPPAGSEQTVPQRVVVPDAMIDRKLGELGNLERREQFGSDVNRALARRLAERKTSGPHPARALADDGQFGTPLSIRELATRTWGLTAFEHESPLEDFRSKAAERGRLWAGSDTALNDATREWAAEWGAERMTETLLDCTMWAAGLGDIHGAATYLQATEAPENFAADVATWLVIER